MLAGKIRHEDSAGHEGLIEAGGIQWMTAGRGIIHSEMPEQEDGRLAGFQLWVNLPAADKMCEPIYHEYAAAEIPVEIRNNGVTIRVITGSTSTQICGPVSGVATDPLYLDIFLPPGCYLNESLPDARAAFIFVIEGSLSLIDASGNRPIMAKQLGVLSKGDRVAGKAGDAGAVSYTHMTLPTNREV